MPSLRRLDRTIRRGRGRSWPGRCSLAPGAGRGRRRTAGFGILAWAHIVLVLGFGAYLPYSKHLHILSSEPNVYFRNLEPRGALRKMDLELEPAAWGRSPSSARRALEDLTWRHLLDPLSCTECGRCMEFCPAAMTGKTLSPKHFMEGLRDQIGAAETALAAAASAQRAARGGANGGAEASEAALAMAAAACRRGARVSRSWTTPSPRRRSGSARPAAGAWRAARCSSSTSTAIVEIRRNLVLEESRVPQGAQRRVPQHGDRGQPLGTAEGAPASTGRRGWRSRCSGADGSGPMPTAMQRAGGVLYWVGCAGAFDDRNRKVVRAMAQLLRQAGVPFAVLGSGETCSGDPARRAGNEYLYQMLAQENVATLAAAHAEHGVRTIVASCPHCFNTIRNEYPQFGLPGIEVIHHTQLLDRLVADGRLRPAEHHEAVVAYHDACYLGRYNGVYEPGRRVVESVPGQDLVEMDLHHRRGMCCGAGGARMWMEEHEGQRINHRRVEQALAKVPDAIATACPFCLVMLRDGSRTWSAPTSRCVDVAELLAEATGAWAGRRRRTPTEAAEA